MVLPSLNAKEIIGPVLPSKKRARENTLTLGCDGEHFFTSRFLSHSNLMNDRRPGSNQGRHSLQNTYIADLTPSGWATVVQHSYDLSDRHTGAVEWYQKKVLASLP